MNFVSSQDVLTLAVITACSDRHDEANTVENQDGHHFNNCGAEVESEDLLIRERLSHRQRTLSAMMLLSRGTLMLLVGDEITNSQGSNNHKAVTIMLIVRAMKLLGLTRRRQINNYWILSVDYRRSEQLINFYFNPVFYAKESDHLITNWMLSGTI